MKQNKPDYHVVSFSGGKDSTAMLLRMLELGMRIDCILFCDTGLEFPAMYAHIDKLEQETGCKITRLKAANSYEYLMLEKPVSRKANTKFAKRYGLNHNGYGWAGPKMRWCTEKLKNQPRKRFLRELCEHYTVIEYVGLAADEEYRLKRRTNQNPNHRHPLMDWGWTEVDCLRYCQEKGYSWDGLYDIFHRVSCWCCPLQSLQELRNLHKFFPELWDQLKRWDKSTWRQFRADYSVEQLEARFLLEQQRLADGLPITGKAFFDALRTHLRSIV